MKNTKLQTMRNKKGLTQVQVAEKALISERAYQDYEAGKRTPNVITARLIAQALDCKIEDIF